MTGDTARNGYVKGSGPSLDWNGGEGIAIFFGQAAQALAFVAEDQGDGSPERFVVQGLFGIGVESNDLDVMVPHCFQGPCQVGDADDVHAFGGPCGGFDGRPGQGGGPVLGQDNGEGPECFGGANDGSQVSRVFDAIQDDDEVLGMGLQAIQQLFKGGLHAHADAQGDALVGSRSCQSVEHLAFYQAWSHPAVFGQLQGSLKFFSASPL